MYRVRAILHAGRTLAVLVLLVVGGGCATLPDAPPLAAHIARYRLDQLTRSRVLEERLVVDLNTGRAVFTDFNRTPHPQQLLPQQLVQLRQALLKGDILGRTFRPSPRESDPAYYDVELFFDGVIDPMTSSWAVPPAGGLPGGAKTVNETFAAVQRSIRPRMQDIDLIR